MDLLNDYSDSEESSVDDVNVRIKPVSVSLAPPIPDECTHATNTQLTLALASTHQPITPWNPAGNAYNFTMNDATFRRESNSFGRTGTCKDPENEHHIKSTSIYATNPESDEHQTRVTELMTSKRESKTTKSPPTSPTRKRARKEAPAKLVVPTSKLYIREDEVNYQGRSCFDIPVGARTYEQLESYTSYIPKRCVHEFKNTHKGGASCVRFIPRYGHLMLSAGLDGDAKIWEVGGEKNRCIRRYSGHSKGIRDVSFSPDGTSFLTSSYDKSILLWDTETGRVKSSFDIRSIPYCVRFNPTEGNEFLAGCGDKKVLQYDVRDANNTVQIYDAHMGAVNSIAFIDDSRRFVTSADDKVLRVWDYGIPIVIKYVGDARSHSMPVILQHPSRKWLACQSMDNQVAVFAARDKFKLNSKKSFRGHNVAGYACGLTVSPDGRFLGSGDSTGRMYFWDWKTTRTFRTLEAHKGVVIDVAWHPTKTSFVASAGWDGDIRLWD